jgi:hypothetical protein
LKSIPHFLRENRAVLLGNFSGLFSLKEEEDKMDRNAASNRSGSGTIVSERSALPIF